MRFLFVLFLALGAGIGLTVLAEKPGYVLISRETWSVETTFTLFVLGLITVIVVSYVLLRILFYLFTTPERVRKWNKQRNRDQAFHNIHAGMTDALRGNWDHALKLLTKPSEYNPMPEITLSVAAWIAQQKHDLELRDDYLAAAASADDTGITTEIVKSYLQHDSGQYEQALASAQLLHQQIKSSPVVYRLLIDLMQATEQWNDLYALLSRTGPAYALRDDEHDVLMNHAAVMLLAGSTDLSSTKEHWKNLLKKTRKEPAVIASYCRMLDQYSATTDAEAMVRNTLRDTWSEELVELYGLLETGDSASQLKQAEQWTREHPSDTTLMLTLGRLSIHNSLWGMARSYLEVAVQNGDQPEAFLELARLYESLGEKDAAHGIYKRGLEMAVPMKTVQKKIAKQNHAEETGPGITAQEPSLAYSNESK